jgi:hypothetical protein
MASGTAIDDELESTVLTLRTVGEKAPRGLLGGVSGFAGCLFGFDFCFGRWGC